MRVGSLTVGAMTGKGREIVDFMVRRKMNVLCVQESGWRGDNGCKLVYSRANKELEWSEFREQMIGKWLSNCAFKGENINILSAYAPQVGCSEEEKTSF